MPKRGDGHRSKERPDPNCYTVKGRRTAEIPEKRNCMHCEKEFAPLSRWNRFCSTCEMRMRRPGKEGKMVYGDGKFRCDL